MDHTILPKTIANSHVISSKGCAARPDHLHFTPAGYRELGTRYAQKMLSLLGYKMAEPKVAGKILIELSEEQVSG
jgi:hypothetical protein